MVRVVGHLHSFSQLTPIMYPFQKKHRRPIPMAVNNWTTNDSAASEQPGNNISANQNESNIPHLAILNRTVIDADKAQRAVEALRYNSYQDRRKRCERESFNDSDLEMYDTAMSIDESMSRDTEEEKTCEEENLENRLASDTMTTSDSTEAQQTTDDVLIRKARRRQKNKLSAKAYRDRKRTKAQEQHQVLANLEAEQMYLLNRIQKLEEEKRRFLQYLQSEMNIDVKKYENDVSMSTST